MLKTVQEINQSSLRMSRLSRLPKVNAFMDLGTQASTGNTMTIPVIIWSVCNFPPNIPGFRNSITIRQNKLEIEKTQNNLTNTTPSSWNLPQRWLKIKLQTTLQNYQAAQEQLKSAQSYFNLIEKGYKEGVNSLIEFLDARNQLTNSQLQLNLRHLKC